MRKSTSVRHLHCDVVEWLVQLTWGAPTEKIHRVLLVVIHWNSFDCPRLFRAFCASTRCDLYASTWCNLGRSTTAFPSGRANDGIQRYFRQCSSLSYFRYRHGCRMDLPGPTTSVGTRTDYSMTPWDYSACATWHLMAWGARTMVEEYSNRKLYMSCTV
jgi:hypothetical protein